MLVTVTQKYARSETRRLARPARGPTACSPLDSIRKRSVSMLSEPMNVTNTIMKKQKASDFTSANQCSELKKMEIQNKYSVWSHEDPKGK